jgi:S-adenosyl-L-methionine hydrolase (adenosine-forming)
VLITLTTDFGTQDPFVGIMKGVIARINPQAAVVDLTHGVPPQNILVAAMILSHAMEYFPRQTIHVAVVDPGVGSRRRALMVEIDDTYLIGPDNGVLSLACEERKPTRIIQLSNPSYYLKPTSGTFHGRDIFAPVAAYLSLGIVPEAFGETVDDYVRVSQPEVVRTELSLTGEIVYIDGFGNVFTNIRAQDLTEVDREELSISLGELTIRGLAPHYSAAEDGRPVAVINSWGVLEIALNKGNLAGRFSIRIGEKVYVTS